MRECRPHWERQIISSMLIPMSRSTRFVAAWQIFINVCVLWWWKASPKASGSLPWPQLEHAATIIEFFAHLSIWEDPDHHQNLISSSFHHPRPLHRISLQSVHNVLSNVVHYQTNRQTDKPMLPKPNLVCQGSNKHSLAKAISILPG